VCSLLLFGELDLGAGVLGWTFFELNKTLTPGVVVVFVLA